MTFKEKLRVTVRGYKTLNRLSPGLLPVLIIQGILDALLPFIGIYMSAQIITALAAQRELSHVLWLAALTVGAGFLVALINSGCNRIRQYCENRFWRVVEQPLHEKIQQMDYQCVEDAKVHEAYSHLVLIRNTNGLGLPRLIWSMNQGIRALFTVIFSVTLTVSAFVAQPTQDPGAFSFLFTPWCTALVLLLTAGNVALDVWRTSVGTKKVTKTMEDFQQGNRVGMYFMRNLLFSYQAGKDMKLYSMREILQREMGGVMDTMNKIMKKFHLLQGKFNCFGAVTGTIFTALIYSYIGLKALFGAFAVGSIVQYAGSLSQLGGGISDLMSNVGLLLYNAEALQKFFAFTDMPDQKYQGTLSVEKRADNDYEIEFKNVSFRYPGTEVDVLKDLSLKFNIGKRMAVVGRNGSGKTTMIKLLCRLYDPTEGTITLNGIDIRKYSYDDYMGVFSVVFQDFKLFSFSLGQNVAAGVDYDPARARESLEKAGLKERLAAMPKGLETPLYKDFEEDGVEISGGEAQKIALARALYKNAPFMILDEPTAALDPVSEYEIYAKFNEIVGEKTAVFISHRLSSCRFCDDIVVFDEGRMVQRGNHDVLLSDAEGRYCALWNAQAQYYT